MHDFVDHNLLMMPYGTDESTGYPLWLLTRQRFAVVLPKCICCGTENVISAPLDKTRMELCYECYNRVQSLRMAKSRLSVNSSIKSYNTFVDKLEWFEDKKRQGLWAPKWLADAWRSAAVVKPYIDEALAKEADYEKLQYKHITYCDYCSKKGHTRLLNTKHICFDCNKRRERYTYLRNNVMKLTDAEVVEFNKILDEYAVLQKRGDWAPDIPEMRRRIACRVNSVK